MSNASLVKIKECIDARDSFILEAGAGSGKTWTLIESIKYILMKRAEELNRNGQFITCITYTNVAANEILQRIDNNPLVIVSTIHKYLWSIIKNFQCEIKNKIISLNKSQLLPIDNLESTIKNIEISYSEYGKNLQIGEISHDDIINISYDLFREHPKLAILVSNKYPIIFVDEYQDTAKEVVELLLGSLLEIHKNKVIVGFFGDSMQNIYNDGIGKITNEKLIWITKEENFRCSHAVINLLNKMRPTLIQKPSGSNLSGKIIFIHCNDGLGDSNNYQIVTDYLDSHEWRDGRTMSTKYLMLTHKGIAGRLEYENLLDVYNKFNKFGRNMLYEKKEVFSDFLMNKIEKISDLYKNKMYGEFLSILKKENLKKHEDKIRIKILMDELNDLRENGNVGDVLSFIFNNKVLPKPEKIEYFELLSSEDNVTDEQKENVSFYKNLLSVKYKEVIKLNEYIEDKTPFSTKHGVKGAEFNNVFMIINDKSWNQYCFNDVFCNNKSNIERYTRTLNLLYVCCSRARNNLILLSLSKIEPLGLKTLCNWFGDANVISVDTLRSQTTLAEET